MISYCSFISLLIILDKVNFLLFLLFWFIFSIVENYLMYKGIKDERKWIKVSYIVTLFIMIIIISFSRERIMN